MQSSRESIARMSDTNPSWIAVATFQVNMNISSEEISPVNFLVANYCLFPSKIPGLLPKIQEFLSRELIYSICWVLNLVTKQDYCSTKITRLLFKTFLIHLKLYCYSSTPLCSFSVKFGCQKVTVRHIIF